MWSSSGIPSTKSGFLCAFTLQTPHFLAFRAQNRGFCVRMGDFSEILGRFDTKSAFLCAFCLRNPHFQAFRAQNRDFCALLPASFFPMPPGRGTAAGWQMMLPAESGTLPHRPWATMPLVEGTEKVSEHSVITQRTIYNYLVVCWIFCIFK